MVGVGILWSVGAVRGGLGPGEPWGLVLAGGREFSLATLLACFRFLEAGSAFAGRYGRLCGAIASNEEIHPEVDRAPVGGILHCMARPWQHRSLVSCFLSLFCLGLVAVAEPSQEQAREGEIFFLRHALAPGFGDPPELTIGDCSTQRNLSAEGRAQARAIGDRLRDEGITDPVLFTSQWCRCMDTAVLLGFGPPRETYGLNSFFQRRDERAGNLEELQRIIDSLPPDGPPVIFVTHQVVVSAMTGRGVSSGEGRWVSVESLQAGAE